VLRGGLALPSALSPPGAFAYDAVSARFILADASSDALTVVSEQSGRATALVRAGWSGRASITAVAINSGNGDMWVAAQGDTSSALHRFQLVSGRRLQTIETPDDAGKTQFAAVTVTPDAVFVLDADGQRIFVLAAGDKTLRAFAALPETITPIGLAHTGASLLLSHAAGLLRVDLSSRTSQPISVAKAVDVSHLHSLAWHNGSLLAIQRHTDGARVVRVRLSTRGTSVTSVDVIEPAGATAGTLSGDHYYFLGTRPAEAGLSFQSVPARNPSAGRSPLKR
jgi:DNA-binding beta-propeller fold protein YncE